MFPRKSLNFNGHLERQTLRDIWRAWPYLPKEILGSAKSSGFCKKSMSECR
jgi:hypothetical protein